MKKFLSILLVLVMTLAMGVTAFAAEEEEGITPDPVTVTKEYTLSGGTAVPSETLEFTVVADENNLGGVTGEVVVGNNNTVTIDGTNAKTQFDITLPRYTKIGVYKYTITEKAGSVQGVTYDTTPIIVIVTISNKKVAATDTTDELMATVAIHKGTEEGKKVSSTDNTAFNNKFEQGKLTVTKEVTGNLGSNTKKFTIHVTFTLPTPAAAAEGETVVQPTAGSPISYTVAGGEAKTLAFNGNTATVDIELASTQSAVFTNLPVGVTYVVEEDASHIAKEGEDITTTEEGYTVTYDNKEGTIGTQEITAKVKNEKKTEIDTGIFLDSLPYVMIVAVAAAAVAVMIIRKRREVEG